MCSSAPRGRRRGRAVRGAAGRAAPLRQLARGAPRAEGEKPLGRRPRFVCGRARRASTCGRFRAPARPAASPMRISTRSSLRRPGLARAPGLQPKTAVKDIKVVGLRRRIAEKMATARTRAFPTSPMSRRSTSPRSRSCGRRSTSRKRHGPAEADALAVPDARHGAGDRRAAPSECAVRRRGGRRASACRRPYRHRRADGRRAHGAGGAGTPRRSISGAAPPR